MWSRNPASAGNNPVRDAFRIGGVTLSAALFLIGYLVLVGHLLRESNRWQFSGSPISTAVQAPLPELTISTGDLRESLELETVCLESTEFDLPTLRAWETDLHGEPRRIVFKGQRAVTNPGGAIAGIQLRDGSGELLGEWTFWPGSDDFAVQFSFGHIPDAGLDVLVIDGGTESNRRNTAKQFFAFSGDVLYLIPLEDTEGVIVQNWYYPGTPLGVLPEAKATDDWIAMLRSRDAVQILAALTYLGGEFHSASRPLPCLSDPERLKVESIRVLRANEQICGLVARHAIAENPWIREAALLALRPIRQAVVSPSLSPPARRTNLETF